MKKQRVEQLQNEWKTFVKGKRLEDIMTKDAENVDRLAQILLSFTLTDFTYQDEFEHEEKIVYVLCFQQENGEPLRMYCPPEPDNWELNVGYIANKYDTQANPIGVQLWEGIEFSEMYGDENLESLYQEWMDDFYSKVKFDLIYRVCKEEDREEKNQKEIDTCTFLYQGASIDEFVREGNDVYALLSNGRKLKISL